MCCLAQGQRNGVTSGRLHCVVHSLHVLTNYFFNVAIYLWPPHITESKQFHFINPWVGEMQLLEQTAL